MEKNLIARRIADRIHIFDTLFYYNLTHRARESKAQTQNNEPYVLSDRCYNRVKKYTKGTNIFEKDFIIIPINKNGHWFAAVICYPSRDEFIEVIGKYPKRSCICFMDSTQSAHSRCGLAAPLRHFLAKEWESKKTTKKNFSESSMPEMYLKLPKQINDFDCGLYVLQNIENFLINPDYLIERICKDPAINLGVWFSFSSVSSMRRTIKRLIERKSKN
ncbi:sentrin-specific protease 6-like isoform X2 [Panonychus citri]|uniref:sentrin-specific protease 6-like isoform X2 n=1 Tax=Panonychus citri TaxID=50023 RepID=UPI00230817BB|nr:sentrin-specific protease 6-like isoform X2 [Panonychus citri]XP_053203309.1 sentrin-specific protease 6-like isoform X2 [Panonychus citri]